MKRDRRTMSLKPELIEILEKYSKEKRIDSVSRVVERILFDPGASKEFHEYLETSNT